MERHREPLSRAGIFWPHELADVTRKGRQNIVAKMEKYLIAERQRGVSNNWTYDLARHNALWRAYRAEKKALEEFRD